MKAFPHSLYSGVLSCENPHMMSGKTVATKGIPAYFALKVYCLWNGKCYLEQKQSRHKILAHILCIHKASQCECAIAA